MWDDITANLGRLRLDSTAFWYHKYGLAVALAGLYTAQLASVEADLAVKGENGVMKKHPTSTIMNQMLTQIRQYSNDLGLNPSALAAMNSGDDPATPRSRMEELIRGRR